MIPAVIIFWFILTGHRLILYSIDSGSCNPQLGIYEKIDTYIEVVMSGVVPPILFITLGCLLLRNVRSVARRRVAPGAAGTGGPQTTSVSNSLIQQIDSQLSTMILLQSFVAIPSFVPFGAQNLYTSITRYWIKTPYYLSYENIFVELIRLFSYLFYSTSFYISCISSPGFRKQILHITRIRRETEPSMLTVTTH